MPGVNKDAVSLEVSEPRKILPWNIFNIFLSHGN